jgi:putative FmdB family regulatory protein
MPLFEFTCQECGAAFEELLSSGELAAGPPPCPQCGSDQVERGFSTFSARAAGSASGPACDMAGGCGAAGAGFS